MAIDNRIKTVLLLGVLTGVLLFVGNLFGPGGLVIAFIIVLLMNGISYFFSHKIVLWMYKAKPASEQEHKKLHKMVEEVAHLAKIPKPQVYIIPSPQPNAFATGRNPKNGIVACTEGILSLLSEDELKGVIAHEISHIKNRDILIQTIAAMIAGIIGFAASMARWGAIFGGFGDDDGPGLLEILVLAILMPIIATLLQLAISRSREYLADETGARIIKNPEALALALEKLERGVENTPMHLGSPTTSSLFVANPFSASGLLSFLSTHPPMEKRIKKLRNMHI
ncbi:MAG: zinc metalloprotease HtpX [Candidatus Woesearchaeota archaeon]